MKTIKLTKNKFALFDDEDFKKLSQYKWHALKVKNTFYAARSQWRDGKQCSPVLMHREILKLTNPKIKTDHKDHEGLNNQKDNLRTCTNQENSRNGLKRKNNASGYKGVYFHKADNKWRAQIGINGKRKTLGAFSSPVHAALAYNIAALNIYGEFAHLNELPI